MNVCVLVLPFLFIVLGSCAEEDAKEAKLRFYYGSIANYTELYIYEARKIFSSSWYNSSRNTVIFSHGYSGQPDGPAVTAVITAYIEDGNSNVALLNWKDLAAMALPSIASSYLNWAAPNARKLGVRFAKTLTELSTAGLDLTKTHLIGHSLAAHIFGITGNTISQEGKMFPSCIVGLDPSRAGFENKPVSMKLNADSANRVVVIHSDSQKYGSKGSMGKVDFWPNYRPTGPVIQPGCDRRPGPMFSMQDLCSHNRSWQFLIDTLKYPRRLIGSHAKNYRTWKKYTEEERKAVTLILGSCDKNAVPGNYFLVTNSESPYGLGQDGL